MLEDAGCSQKANYSIVVALAFLSLMLLCVSIDYMRSGCMHAYRPISAAVRETGLWC